MKVSPSRSVCHAQLLTLDFISLNGRVLGFECEMSPMVVTFGKVVEPVGSEVLLKEWMIGGRSWGFIT